MPSKVNLDGKRIYMIVRRIPSGICDLSTVYSMVVVRTTKVR